jgi:hypothetical protein
MRKFKILLVISALLFVFPSFSAASVTLFDWAFNVNGVAYQLGSGDSMPTTGALNGSGLGTLTWATNAAGAHNFIAFFDHEIAEATNTFFNSYGVVNGAPAVIPGLQSYEIDEPGYVFGNIYGNVLAGALDNTNAVPKGSPEDVSMALGWNFNLNPGDTALITLILSNVAPSGGFYLAHMDSDVLDAVYFSSTLEITPIPVPGTLLLFGSGLVGLFGIGRKRLMRGKN